MSSIKDRVNKALNILNEISWELEEEERKKRIKPCPCANQQARSYVEGVDESKLDKEFFEELWSPIGANDE